MLGLPRYIKLDNSNYYLNIKFTIDRVHLEYIWCVDTILQLDNWHLFSISHTLEEAIKDMNYKISIVASIKDEWSGKYIQKGDYI